MAADMFKSLASHRIIDHPYDDRKDFIILGLCGRVGSGVSTISRILEMRFDEMQLPPPGYDAGYPLGSREYRIIHAYAHENWNTFYKIRTSALITRHILDKDVTAFCTYIESISHCKDELIKNQAEAFFDAEMECDWEQYYKYQQKTKKEDICSPWKLFEYDCYVEELENGAKIAEAASEDEMLECEIHFGRNSADRSDALAKVKGEDTVKFICFPKTGKCCFKNKELSKLLKKYAECRKNKSGFKNPFWFIALKQYLYDFLPREANKLWSELQQVSQSLPTLALQCLGNNLRMNKQPYYIENETDPANVSLRRDGYECLAEEINLAIKVLRAYQLVLKAPKPEYDDDVKMSIGSDRDNQNPQNSQNPKNPREVRTAIVIDSIKNPYESLYLKARYNNYYLIGVYTEDVERHKRLREREHFVSDDIRAIDIIENNAKLKKEIRTYQKYLEQKAEAEKNNKSVPLCTTPDIIQKLYTQFQERGLLENLQYISPFILQNVSSCLESADILINNIRDDNSYTYLKKTLLRYVSLIMNPGLVLPTPVERCMEIANTAKLNSGCISRQVGAVITDSEYHLLSIGWNQQPEGQMPCAYRDLCELHHHWDDSAYSEYESDDDDSFKKVIAEQVSCFWDTKDSPLTEKGKLPVYCFKDYQNGITGERNQVHTRALHGEETAFLNLGANRERAVNGILFTTSSPCELCAKKAKYMGISKIYYVETYAGVSQKHVLNIGKHRPDLILFTGAIGTAYTKLFTPLLPRKDENEMWLGARMGHKLYKEIEKRKGSDKERGDSQ